MQSAQIPAKHANLILTTQDIPTPTGSQLLIKIHSAAINPIDYKIQKAGRFFETFPRVLGSDAAGIVEAVGPDVKKFTKGDRVISFVPIFMQPGAECRFGCFQEYTLTEEVGTAVLPENVGFDEGCTIPLALCTAAEGMYSFLDLAKPSDKPEPKNEWLLIWGGSASVGQFAIQLAKASGYKVVTTASPAGHEWLKKLGADVVVDYRDDNVFAEIEKATGGKLTMLYDAISTKATIEQGLKCLPNGGKISYVQLTPETAEVACPENIKYLRVFAGNLLGNNKPLGYEIMAWVGKALESGQLRGNPVKTREGGLHGLQASLDHYQKEGINGAKYVFNP